ncbi:MAG: SDR family oxidoreductase [Candidatus Magasanikbacteria bacterium RIFCSPHIGHO2_01_FULL_33_34]|uniref:SDR family oxidoreductase n=1 Tax=Candidatus Magasanikbacteria bacterium RIFCSPHIGHO2_01_FULL_33_34 TaxID=1798671 RepID=A0A1F6LK41_9BACT|nr:MAG: SDR family oxidoreductase [Candidatus Magasanikbacteria bacterium RIFCSPHIGHO2_01_FULL_33_34]OGH65543.1 MAG: SDR family oxidoreductase [Candidatus Magasanikbacteria bacterium RIFCSPHIGHO2_02_FULL_33_17]OGH76253.1 MAG: SDR family oxidoreductase [Candidatus Magasanikbacteria bacterium RIFCSPLOWO2_01_FULL_33_34]OGH81103.1 MAG: SDR family oxidoreductase [Candidatus Magasanikbacteria bacterium RIFCSPLOWO2_12_FULL_34_7]
MNLPSISQLINLNNKTAIVTGGAMGIGFGIAYRLAEAGANVVIADINNEVGKNAAKKLNDNGWKAVFVKTDAANEKNVKQTVEFTIKTYGDINILVNNAGIYPITPIKQMLLSDFEKIMAANLKSVFMFTKAVTEIMIKQGNGGKIINITSIDALHPSSVGLAAYDASKHGLWGFTKNTALEFASNNIQINAIAPGGISTPGTGAGKPTTPEMKVILKKFLNKIPMKRMGEPDDIGKVALFLASDLSSYMTGSQIVVDGGVLLS